MANRLINCLQKVTATVEDDKGKKVHVFDHEMKRAMIAEANRNLAKRIKPGVPAMSVQEAEVAAVTELRDKATQDIDKVEDALTAQVAPKVPPAGVRRPVDREAKTAEAFARMHAHPEKALLLAQRIQADYQRVRAETLEMVASMPPEASKQEYKDLRKVRAFAELDALVKALPPSVASVIYGNTETLAKLRATDASLGAFMVKKIESIDREMEKHFRKIYQEAINDLLYAKRARKQPSGVKKSTIGADAQDVVNRVTGYTALSGEEIAKRYQAIEAELEAGLAPDEESAKLMEQHELATFGAIKEMSAGQLEAALTDLQNTIKTGRAEWGAKEEARLAEQKLKAAKLVTAIGPSSESAVAEQNTHKLRNWIRNYARTHTSLIQIIDRLFPGIDFGDEWVTKAVKADQDDQTYVRKINERLYDAIGAAAGTRLPWKIGSILQEMRENRTIPVPDGGKASKNEAIQFLYMWDQPKVQEKMILHGWTPKHIQALKDAVADPVSQAVMTFMRKAYDEIYQKVDPVYVSQYGMHLPRVEGHYAPARHRAAGAITHMTPTGLGPSSGITPGSLKARVEHKADLLQVDAMDVFREHLLQMSHWAHFAPFIRETRGVLGNAKVKKALEGQIGSTGVGDLQKQLDVVTRGGVARSMDVSATNDMISYITRGAAVTGLAFSAYTGAIQLDSVIRWMNAIPPHRWGHALMLHQWLPKISAMWHSDAVQNRVKGGMNPAMQAAMESNRLTPSNMVLAAHAGFWHLRMIDGVLTSVSSAIVYTDAINQKMTHEQAMEKMSEAVARYSQPTLSVAKSQGLLTANSPSRMLFLYMADPVSKTALIAEGMIKIGRGIANRDIKLVEKGVGDIVAVEVYALLAQTVSSLWTTFVGDDEGKEEAWDYHKFLRAMVVAPLQGWFLAGNFFEGITRILFNEKWFPPNTPMARIAQGVQRGFNNWDDLMTLDPSDPDFRKAFESLMDTVGLLAGPYAVVPALFKESSKARRVIEDWKE